MFLIVYLGQFFYDYARICEDLAGVSEIILGLV